MKHSFTLCVFCAFFFLIPAVICFGQDDQVGNATWHETDSLDLTAFHASLPIRSLVRITNLENNKVVYATITDRIPNDPERVLDVSKEAARLLEMNEAGNTLVYFRVIQGGASDSSAEEMTAGVPEIAAVSAQGAGERTPQPPARTVVPPELSSPKQPQWIIVQPDQAAPSSPPSVAQPPAPLPPPVSPSVAPSPAGGRSAKIVPSMPNPNGRGVYRVQVGAYSNTTFAQESYDRLKSAGFSPAFERHGNLYRVVVTGIRAAEMTNVAQRLGAAGFAEAWVREEN